MDANPIHSRLLPGEKILWSGRPAQGILLTGSDWFMIAFGLVFASIPLFGFSQIGASGDMGFFALIPILFVGIGLYIAFGRLPVDAWQRQTMNYAVTDQRVLISRGNPFPKFQAFGLKQLPETTLTELPDGRGTIQFGQRPVGSRGRTQTGISPAFDTVPLFYAIDNPRQVFDTVQRAAGNL